MTSANKIWAVVPAGGRGARMGSELPKQYLQLAGKTILEHTLARLLGEPRIAGVVVAMAAGDDLGQAIVAAHAPRVRTAAGGAERYILDVMNGLLACGASPEPADWPRTSLPPKLQGRYTGRTHLYALQFYCEPRTATGGGLAGGGCRPWFKRGVPYWDYRQLVHIGVARSAAGAVLPDKTLAVVAGY